MSLEVKHGAWEAHPGSQGKGPALLSTVQRLQVTPVQGSQLWMGLLPPTWH